MIVASYTDDDVFFVTEEQERGSHFLGVRMDTEREMQPVNYRWDP